MMSRPVSLLVATLVASGCGAGVESAPAPAGARPTATAPPPAAGPDRLAEDPVEAIRALRSLAASERPDAVHAYVDTAFGERLPSVPDLLDVLGPAPEGCDVELSRDVGYGAIAIAPPTVDDTEEQVAGIEAIIQVLQSAVEVHGTCTMMTEPEADEDGPVGEREPYEMAVFAIALRRDEQLGWRLLGWRHFIAE